MNKIYRLVWSALQKTYVAVAESARGRGKASKTHRTRSSSRHAQKILGVAILSIGFSQGVWAADCSPNPLSTIISVTVACTLPAGATYTIAAGGGIYGDGRGAIVSQAGASLWNDGGVGGSNGQTGYVALPAITNNTTMNFFVNNGYIGDGFVNSGTLVSLLNTGQFPQVSGGYCSPGITNSGSIGTLTNTNTDGSVGLRVTNSGTVTTVNNLGGVAFYNKVPLAYNVIIQSPSQYGNLYWGTYGASTPMAFNIYGNTGTTIGQWYCRINISYWHL